MQICHTVQFALPKGCFSEHVMTSIIELRILEYPTPQIQV